MLVTVGLETHPPWLDGDVLRRLRRRQQRIVDNG